MKMRNECKKVKFVKKQSALFEGALYKKMLQNHIRINVVDSIKNEEKLKKFISKNIEILSLPNLFGNFTVIA